MQRYATMREVFGETPRIIAHWTVCFRIVRSALYTIYVPFGINMCWWGKSNTSLTYDSCGKHQRSERATAAGACVIRHW